MPRRLPVPIECACVETSWEAFEGALKDLRQELSDQSGRSLLFRGQSNSCWKLETTLERYRKRNMLFIEYYRLISALRPEIETFTENQWAIPKYYDVEKQAQNYDSLSLSQTFEGTPAYDYMIYLRHHGFPSPLLDWTCSPRIAAYFAFRNATHNGKASIYVLSERNMQSGSSGVPGINRLGEYVKAHRRHFLQQSDYTMCLVFNSDNEWRFSGHETALNVKNTRHSPYRNFDFWKFDIPCAERKKILHALDEYNLNGFSLYGSEESLMETMAIRKLDS